MANHDSRTTDHDLVFIEGLEIEAVIGIYDWERRVRQPLVFDIEMAFDNRRPAASDAIGDTLDYKAVSKRLIAFVSQSSYGLVETLAEQCAGIILREFDVRRVRLKLSKPGAVRGARAVGVQIVRARGEAAPLQEPATQSAQATPAVAIPAPAQVAPPPAPADVAGPIPLPAQAEPAGRAAAAPPAPESPASELPSPEPPAPALMLAQLERRVGGSPARSPFADTVTAAGAPSRAEAMIAAISGGRAAAPARAAQALSAQASAGATCPAYLSLGSNIEPEKNLRLAVAALRARFGAIEVSPVYRTRAVGFDGPDFLNAIALVHSDLNPFALHRWLHRLEEAQGRDRRDAAYSNRPLDIDIIYFGDFVLDGPGDFQLPRPELQHAFVLKPLADLAPDFVDPIRNRTLAQLWAIHPERESPPAQVALAL